MVKIGKVVAALVVCLAVVASAYADSGYTGPKTPGTLKHSYFISGDKEAIAKLKASSVFCRWIKGHVYLHISFRNRLGAHITVHVQPNYRLANAGLHGDGLGSQKDFGIDPGAFRAVYEDLGTPEGVSGHPRITVCGPEINGVDLG